MTNRILYLSIVLCFSSAATVQSQELSGENQEVRNNNENQELLLAQELSCPTGSTPNPFESTVSRLVCDVDSNDKKTFPLTDEAPTVVRIEDLPIRINTSYPEWYTQNEGTGIANENSFHYYHTLMEPGAAKPAYDSEGIACYTFFLRPEKTYFAHNHPPREFYYIYSGEGTWYGGDEVQEVGPGTFIVHPPYLSHGFTNTSKTEELSAFVCWWQTPDDPADILDHGGLPTNPCLVEQEATAKPYAVDEVCVD
ncbi:MAG: cupin domain-containing protein [Symploca sp. SIO1C2]|nr:cupin domain-containing protein [Symploca sp. SIO1C2]